MSHFQEASPDRYDMAERSYREAWNTTSLSQVVKAADLVLVVSPYEAHAMKELGADEAKLFLFPGGVQELTDVAASVEPFERKYGIPAGTKVVTSLGTVEERKNTLSVVEVAKRLAQRPDIHFVIAGLEQGDYGKKVRDEATSMPNVSVLGPISEDDKSALIKSTSVNIIMSRSEALGIAQLEFMANGVPVVTSGTGGQLWLVKNGENGIVVDGPDDVTGAARAVEKIAENPSLRRRLGVVARRRASQYSMGRLVHELSKRLETMSQERSDEDSLRRGLPEQEEVLEAMVSGPTRVIVTNRRLMVKNDRSGSDPISISLKRIKKVKSAVRYPWYVLGAGALSTSRLLISQMVHPWLGFFDGLLGSSTVSAAFVPAAALAAATGVFFVAMRRSGYFVETDTGHVFVPKEFLRLLRLVDRLTSVEIFKNNE